MVLNICAGLGVQAARSSRAMCLLRYACCMLQAIHILQREACSRLSLPAAAEPRAAAAVRARARKRRDVQQAWAWLCGTAARHGRTLLMPDTCRANRTWLARSRSLSATVSSTIAGRAAAQHLRGGCRNRCQGKLRPRAARPAHSPAPATRHAPHARLRAGEVGAWR